MSEGNIRLQIRLQIGKVYKYNSLSAFGLYYTNNYIRVFGPTRMDGNIMQVRVKGWDEEFKEWDQNRWVDIEQPSSEMEEVSDLEVLVVLGYNTRGENDIRTRRIS